jgi:hypothetical protein
MSKFKKGDKVVMHTCGEASFGEYEGKIWTCRGDSYMNHPGPYGTEVVFLEGFSGHFCCEYLQLVKIEPEPTNVAGIPLDFLKELESLGALEVGNVLILVDSYDEVELVQVKKVKVSKQDGEEVIFDLESNRYFNVGMYLEGNSWVRKVYIFGQDKIKKHG